MSWVEPWRLLVPLLVQPRVDTHLRSQWVSNPALRAICNLFMCSTYNYFCACYYLQIVISEVTAVPFTRVSIGHIDVMIIHSSLLLLSYTAVVCLQLLEFPF